MHVFLAPEIRYYVMAQGKKKHLIITKLYDFGGTNNHLKQLIAYLGKDNVILVLATANELNYLKEITDEADVKVILQPNLHPYAHLRYRFTTNVKEFFKIISTIAVIKLLSLKYNCVTVNICSAESEKYLYLLWLPFVKVFYFLHSTPQPKYTGFTSFTCNKTLGQKKAIVTVSNANRLVILKNWEITDPKKQFVKVVYNCLPADYEKDIKPHVKSESQQVVLTLGHVIDYKNPTTWLTVAKMVTANNADVVFKWVGNGPLYSDFEKSVRDFDRIRFEGYRNNPKDYLASAVIYYQPSIYETHGIAVVEAMAHGLPCIVSNAGGLPESVVNGYNGILADANDAEKQAGAMLQLLNDGDERTQFGHAGYQRYKEIFTYASFKKNMDVLYST
ncbi:glycosyltransferase family 4 protein [Mucilaginibacter sp. HD30]